MADSVKCTRAGCGYYTFEVEGFSAFIRDVAPLFVSPRIQLGPDMRVEGQEFVWRGMRDPSWFLQSSLSRAASKEIVSKGEQWQKDVSELTTRHLMEFINHLRGLSLLDRKHDDLYALLGRHIGKFYTSFDNVLESMDQDLRSLTLELFALGQHHGLYTPFLDWTYIPLIALYFAFVEQDDRVDGVGHRVVFALNKTAVERMCPPNEVTAREGIRFVGSMAHDNPRIVGQAGLFTFVPPHLPVDQWVVARCDRPPEERWPVLLRFLIRNSGRKKCLDELNTLNINSRTVFPDRFGSALHANFRLESFKETLLGVPR
ncbi:MAG: FRG domain-containing protein [Bryobacterales bacterium]|nr:FRG domain-containing protein [Bryobacterales bacterium]